MGKERVLKRRGGPIGMRRKGGKGEGEKKIEDGEQRRRRQGDGRSERRRVRVHRKMGEDGGGG